MYDVGDIVKVRNKGATVGVSSAPLINTANSSCEQTVKKDRKKNKLAKASRKQNRRR